MTTVRSREEGSRPAGGAIAFGIFSFVSCCSPISSASLRTSPSTARLVVSTCLGRRASACHRGWAHREPAPHGEPAIQGWRRSFLNPGCRSPGVALPSARRHNRQTWWEEGPWSSQSSAIRF